MLKAIKSLIKLFNKFSLIHLLLNTFYVFSRTEGNLFTATV